MVWYLLIRAARAAGSGRRRNGGCGTILAVLFIIAFFISLILYNTQGHA